MKLSAKEIAVFGMLGSLLYASKLAMEALPNVHLLAVIITAITVVYRWRALFPIYIFVFLTGLLGGFSAWWVPHLYIWTVLWGAVMLLPRTLSRSTSRLLYMLVCALHGFLFGVLYAPAQALLFGLSFEEMLVWIASGAVFDVIHGFSNLFFSILVVPLVNVLKRFS